MKSIIVLCSLVVVIYAAPQQNPNDVQVLRYENDNSGLNQYRFGYELSDGTRRDEQGELKNPESENPALSVSGSYSWVAPDGTVYTVTYTADETGYHPVVQIGGGGGIPGAVVASLLG